MHNKTATAVAMQQQSAQAAFEALMAHRADMPTQLYPPEYVDALAWALAWQVAQPELKKQEPPPLDGPVFGL